MVTTMYIEVNGVGFSVVEYNDGISIMTAEKTEDIHLRYNDCLPEGVFGPFKNGAKEFRNMGEIFNWLDVASTYINKQ